MSLMTIVHALGGDLYDRGRRALIPGPGHSRRDRSVSLLLSDGRLVVHSFGRSSWREVLDELRDHGLVDQERRPRSAPGRSRCVEPELSAEQRTAVAARLWSEAQPLARQVSMTHVRSRGVLRPAPVSAALRHHPATPSAVYLGRGVRRPALLAAVTSAEGRLCAVEITYLSPDGRRADELRTPRKIVGALPSSCAVRLDPAASEMAVGEGVFSTLSGSDRFRLPGWALLSAGNLRTWVAPSQVRRVLITADRGVEGERSARWLRRRLNATSAHASIAWPPLPANDWNEAGQGRGEGEEGCA